MTAYRTSPVVTEGHPPGSSKIIINETMERFSYYGLRTILSIVLISFLPMDQLMTEQEAQAVFHQFAAWNYFFPLAGALLADIWLGKYRTILYLSLVYTAGCAVLAFDQSRSSIYLGLFLIALGSGGIKPSVSACLGDQYGEKNKGLIDSAMAWFYRGINFGALGSTLLTPILLSEFGPRVAFSVPAIGMGLATFVFWSGRKQYAHIPPKGTEFLKELREGLRPLMKLAGLFLFMSAFFALYDQSGSEWVIQASKMDLNFLWIEWLPAQVQIINPLLIVLFAGPIEAKIFPLLKKLHPSDLVRVAIGFFLTAASFAVVTWIEKELEAGKVINIGWQLLAYVILTAGEIMAYMSVLQISYRKATPSMKSFVSSVFLLGVTLGNMFTSGVNCVIQNEPPSFVPDKAGVYAVSLTVSDGGFFETSTVQVTAMDGKDFHAHEAQRTAEQKKEQLKPKEMSVSAGRMRAVRPGTRDVALFGEFDAGDVKGSTSYNWEIVSVPEGSRLTSSGIKGKDHRLATFTPDAPGSYKFRFEGRAGNVKKDDTVEILVTAENLPPKVNAGSPVTVKVGDEAILNGGATYDPNGDELRYRWSFVSGPTWIVDNTINNRTVVAKGSWLKGPNFYLFFTILMLLVSIAFIPFAMKTDLGPDYVQPTTTEGA